MPLGNLTSQFFANVYLNELDQFVKHQLKAKYYIRYVDDFVILHKNKKILEIYKEKINLFLLQRLKLELHPDKSKIATINNGITFLGFRIFTRHQLLRKKNLYKFERKFLQLKEEYQKDVIEREKVLEIFEGWLAYASHANTYKLKRHITRQFNQFFPIDKTKETKNVSKEERFTQKLQQTEYTFATQKTLQLFKKKLTIAEIALKRSIKESTIWDHLAKLIEYGQVSVWKVVSGKKVSTILKNIHSPEDKLKNIKEGINNPSITFNEINCVLAHIKKKNKKRTIAHYIKWYKHAHCYRKCYFEPAQRALCSKKFERLTQSNNLQMTKKEFLHFFNNNINICILPEQEKLNYISWNHFVTKIRK